MNGEARKADGMARADAGTDEWWRQTCDRAIREAAKLGVPFQAYSLVEWFALPEPRHPNAWGPRFSAAAKAGVIRPAGWAQSRRPTVNASACRVWVGAAVQAA